MGNSCIKQNNKIKPIVIIDSSILKWKSTRKTDFYHSWSSYEKEINVDYCNYGSITPSLYTYPKYGGRIKHNNKLTTFTPIQIEQLLIIV